MSTTAKTVAPDHTDLGLLLTAALGIFKDQLHAQMARAGFDDLGPAFGFVFRALAERPLSLSELASRLGMTSQGALKIAADMEACGYVARHDDEVDRRIRRLSLTTRGRAALREARRFHAVAERRLIQTVGATSVIHTRQVLTAILAQSADNLAEVTASARAF